MSVWVGGSVAEVKQPQTVLPTKNFVLTLLPATPRPIFRPFCSDAIGVLWRYKTEEVDANGVLRRYKTEEVDAIGVLWRYKTEEMDANGVLQS